MASGAATTRAKKASLARAALAPVTPVAASRGMRRTMLFLVVLIAALVLGISRNQPADSDDAPAAIAK